MSGGLLDRWQALGDRLLASPGFQRRAAAFPPTRGVASRRARRLFDLCAGFVYSQVLLACVRLDLFALLAERPRTPEELAAALDLPADSVARLLGAAASLDLAERRRGGRWGLGPLGAALLGNPAVAAMIRHHDLLYGDLADPVALLRRGGRDAALAGFWPYAGGAAADRLDDSAVAPYTALMAASQPLVAADILDAYPVRRHRLLMDVGGGDGSFLAAAAARAPRLRLRLFDLPAVASLAAGRLEAAGLAARAETVGGDFRRDPLPPGADLISLVRVVHDHDDAVAAALLAACRRALGDGGRLLVAEPMAGTPGAEPVGAAYFAFYLLAMGSGRSRTSGELTRLLHGAGFGRVRQVRTTRPMLTGLLVADA